MGVRWTEQLCSIHTWWVPGGLYSLYGGYSYTTDLVGTRLTVQLYRRHDVYQVDCRDIKQTWCVSGGRYSYTVFDGYQVDCTVIKQTWWVPCVLQSYTVGMGGTGWTVQLYSRHVW